MMHKTNTTARTIILGFAMLFGGACTVADPDGEVCEYGGETYAEGDSFASTDGCNSCSCEAGGSVACTEIACNTTTCEIDGTTYQVGDTWQLECNTCSCDSSGDVACTAQACASTCEYGGITYQSGESFDSTDGCNTCTCDTQGLVACTDAACPQD
jgi:hypothetical protein